MQLNYTKAQQLAHGPIHYNLFPQVKFRLPLGPESWVTCRAAPRVTDTGSGGNISRHYVDQNSKAVALYNKYVSM